MSQSNAVEDLIALAHEPSSEKRRELLIAVTNLFLSSGNHGDDTTELFGSVIGMVCDHVEVEDRAHLAEQMAPVTFAPHGLVNKLAHDDEIDVARPVLQQSPVLTDDDLVSVATQKSDGHLQAMAVRKTLRIPVTDVMVERGSQTVLQTVSANYGAEFSDNGASQLVDRAEDDETLLDNLSQRTDLPPAAKEAVERRMEEPRKFGRRGENISADGPMKSLLKDIADQFALLSGLPVKRVERMILYDRMDLVVIIAKSLCLNESVFERLIRYRVQTTGSLLPNMDAMLSQYRTLPPEAAQRMARFLKVRSNADGSPAATQEEFPAQTTDSS